MKDTLLNKVTDVKGAARMLNVSHCRVLQLIYAKRIPAVRLSMGWIIDKEDLAKVKVFKKSGRPSNEDLGLEQCVVEGESVEGTE
jgi:hypothetical protein